MPAKLKAKTTLPLLIGCLSVLSACAVPTGNFCEVVSGPITFPREVAAVVVQGARAQAVKIDTQNRYGDSKCDW